MTSTWLLDTPDTGIQFGDERLPVLSKVNPVTFFGQEIKTEPSG